MFQREAKTFQLTASLTAALTMQFLCIAPGQAHARVARPLVPTKLSPAARHEAAMARLRAHTDAAGQAAKRAALQQVVSSVEQSTQGARLTAAAAKAKVLKLSPAQTKALLQREAPKLLPKLEAARSRPLQPVAVPGVPEKARTGVRPGAMPRLDKAKQGSLTPTLERLYAEVGNESAQVLLDDGSALPIGAMATRPVRLPQMLVGLLSDVGLPLRLEGSLSPPTVDDLAETPETRRSPEVLAVLAAQGATPLALYNYVLTTLRPELYYGSKKGAVGALREKAGNDFDTASLLIALLRAGGTPARYEYGTVRLNAEQALALTGSPSVATAAQLLGQSGVPAAVSSDGTALLMERAWVRAYVSYGDYRGTGPGTGERVWVRLDAGLKQVSWSRPVDLQGLATFDAVAYLSSPTAKMPAEVYEAQLLQAARARNLCNTLDEALYLGKVTQPKLQLLPAESPARVETSLLMFARPPAAYRWQVQVSVGAQAASFELPELQYRTLALRYPGATAADVAAIEAAGGIENVVPFQVQVAPSLRLDGAEVQRFGAVMPGTPQAVTVRATFPGGTPVSMSHRVVAGGVYAVSVTGGLTSPDWATEKKAQTLSGTSDEASEAATHAVQAVYASKQQAAAARLLALTGHVAVQDVFETLAGRDLLVTESFGVPTALRWGNYFIDARRDSLTPFARNGNSGQVANLVRLLGVNGSALEAQVWEDVFARQSLSATRVLQAAAAQGVPVDTFTSGTPSTLVGYTASSIEDMTQALTAGWTVTAPRRPVTVAQYVDAEGYVLLNPATGAGAYKIAFLLNGGESDGPGGVPDSGCGDCDGAEPHVGSTIEVATGQWRENWVELSLPGVGLPLVFSRTYVSGVAASTALGAGWTHSYATRLEAQPNGDVLWLTDSLKRVRFSRQTNGTFVAQAGWTQTLTTLAGGGYRLREKDGMAREFDASGRLTRLTDTSGNAVTCIYSGGLLSEVRDSNGGVGFSFSYQAGLLSGVSDKAGRSVAFTHTGNDLTGATDALAFSETYAYDGQHHLTSRTDKRGFTKYNFYDGMGRWAGGKDALGNENRLQHDAVNRRAVLYDKTGAPTVYEWGAAGELLVVTDAVGNRTAYVRDAALNPTRVEDGRGLATTMTYDARRNLLTRTEADGRVETYTYEATFNHVLTQTATGLPSITNTYDAAGRLLTRRDGLGTTTYGYDGRGQLLTVTAPGTSVTTFGHDANGSVTSIKDATNRTTTIGYDAAGHQTSVTDNAGKSRSMVVNALGWVQSTKDALLHETTYTYDNAGNRLTTTDAAQGVTTHTYDAVGRLTSTTDANGVTRYTEYDAEGRVVASVDGRGKRRQTKYDAAGRVAETVDEVGYTSTVGYCADVPQPCATVDALGRTTLTDFDNVGRVLKQTDEGGRVKVLTYDTGGRLKSEDGPMQPSTDYQYNATTGLLQTVTTPAVAVTYGYDARGNRTSVTANNTTGSQVTTYTYDLANRLLTETNPLTKVTTYTYDTAGSRATKLDANGVTTTYGYDDNRQLLSVSFGDGTSYTYEYDELGRRTKEKGPSHERTMAYDAVGRVKLVTDVTLGATIDSEYDADGHRTLVREGGVDRRFEYDERGLLRRAKLGASGWLTVGHDEIGRRSYITRPNGVRSDWAYDEAGQLLSVLHKKGTATIEGFAYEYDTHGLRVSKTRFDGSREVYGYDATDRLIRVDYGPNRTVEYTLDNLGNRTREVETNRTTTASPVVTTTTGTFNNFNQLTSRTRTGGGLPNLTTTYAYDNNGNTLTETAGATVTTYTWDRDNRLRGVSQPTPPTSYAYDANGLRISRVDGSGTSKYLLDGPSVLAEADVANATTHRYLNNPEAIDDILAFEKAGVAYYPITDALGSLTCVSDVNGDVFSFTTFDVYGKHGQTQGVRATDAGFSGRWMDANGLTYNRHRYAQPANGSWLNEDQWNLRELNAGDPFGIGTGAQMSIVNDPRTHHRFAYGANNPTRFTDPFGRFVFDMQGAALGASIGAIIGAYVGHFICGGSAATGAVIGALIGALAGGGLGWLINLRLILKILPLFVGMNKFELNVVTTLGRVFGIGWSAAKQPFHWNFGSGHLYGYAAYVLTVLAVAVVLGAIMLVVMDLRLRQAEEASRE